jgi:hypothetical protein
MQVKSRFAQLGQGCWPEHLIFWRRHREQLRAKRHRQNTKTGSNKVTYAFDDRLTTLPLVLEDVISSQYMHVMPLKLRGVPRCRGEGKASSCRITQWLQNVLPGASSHSDALKLSGLDVKHCAKSVGMCGDLGQV